VSSFFTSVGILLALATAVGPLVAQQPAIQAKGDSVTIRLVDTDLTTLVNAIAGHLPKPVVAAGLPSVRVSLETPTPVDRATVAELLKGLVEAQGLRFIEDSLYYRINPVPQLERGREATGQQARQQPQVDQVSLHVIRLRHARAADVAATLNLLYGGGGEFSRGGGLSTGTLSDELRREQSGQPPPATEPAGSGGAGSLQGAITIVPDERTNALLIRGSQADFEVLHLATQELDIRPLQVLIEVLIIEARHDRSFSLGADLFVPPQPVDGGTGSAEVIGGGLGDLVITLMGIGKAKIDAVIRTAARRGYVRIVSRPVLLASNNTEARILVGSQRPFVQVSRSLPTDSPTRDQVVQYKDVGTRLVVRPTINQDGYVSLVVQQEINQATNEVQFDAPVISTREASTELLVRDGQTIVIGGLRDMQHDEVQSGVPLLSGIPILGGLFGSADRRTSETELYLFLTPTILQSDEDADRVTQQREPDEGFPE
jgi:general secretion pathway protein D